MAIRNARIRIRLWAVTPYNTDTFRYTAVKIKAKLRRKHQLIED